MGYADHIKRHESDPQISTFYILSSQKKIFRKIFFISVKNSKGHQKMVYLHMPNQCNNKEENDSDRGLGFLD